MYVERVGRIGAGNRAGAADGEAVARGKGRGRVKVAGGRRRPRPRALSAAVPAEVGCASEWPEGRDFQPVGWYRGAYRPIDRRNLSRRSAHDPGVAHRRASTEAHGRKPVRIIF